MKKRDITYSRLQAYIKDKDTAVDYYIRHTLSQTQQMFVWQGLPASIPAAELERILQTAGDAFITRVGNDLYALQGDAGGEGDAYGLPTLYTVANPALKLSATYRIGVDGVRARNDYFAAGLLPVIGKYAVLLTDAHISLNTVAVLSRVTMLLSASDDKTKASAEMFVRKILDGDFSIIGESAFLDGLKVQGTQGNKTLPIHELIELTQYYRAGLSNEIGLNANYNMKRERLNVAEIETMNDYLLPFVDNMLRERVTACTAVNDMFGTDISVALSSAWQINHSVHNDETADETDNETLNETGNETDTETGTETGTETDKDTGVENSSNRRNTRNDADTESNRNSDDL